MFLKLTLVLGIVRMVKQFAETSLKENKWLKWKHSSHCEVSSRLPQSSVEGYYPWMELIWFMLC